MRVMLLVLVLIAALTGPVAVGHADGGCAGARTLSLSTWTPGDVGADGEEWWRLDVPTARRVLMTAGDLPADHRLDVFRGCSVLIASSDRPGMRFEELLLDLEAGDHRLRVTQVGRGAGGGYAMLARSMAERVFVVSTSGGYLGRWGQLEIHGEVYNGTDTPRHYDVRVELFDRHGVRLDLADVEPLLDTVAPGARSPFVARHLNAPVDYHHYRATVVGDDPCCDDGQVTTRVRSVARHQEAGGVSTFHGTLSGGQFWDWSTALTMYGSRGRVMRVVPAEAARREGGYPFNPPFTVVVRDYDHSVQALGWAADAWIASP